MPTLSVLERRAVTAPPSVKASRATPLWPLPALAAWAAAWGVHVVVQALGAGSAVAFAIAVVVSAAFACGALSTWRRLFILGGFPLSFAAAGLLGAVPAWAWLVPLAVLALAYPLGTWRDAPLFPTPRGALAGLQTRVALAPNASILDAGCGLGAGLAELRRVFPQARLVGIERSPLLQRLCRWRRRDAEVRGGDMWAASWREHDLVYLFQRPDTLHRALRKANREMRPGTWLASLAFEAAGVVPAAVIETVPGRAVWLYELPVRLPKGA